MHLTREQWEKLNTVLIGSRWNSFRLETIPGRGIPIATLDDGEQPSVRFAWNGHMWIMQNLF